MPYLAIGVVFQILNQQYMHTSFLLSKRNTFYLANSGSMLLFNVIVSALLIPRFGVMGAVWGRIGAEAFGFVGSLILSRAAFTMPFPRDRILRVLAAVAAMALVVRLVATSASEQGPTLLFAQIPAGIGVYAAAAWLLDIGGLRAGLRGFMLARWRLGGVSP
jgi:O-antigen/teichoic acid export membrane protein